MTALVKRLCSLADDELFAVSEAIDGELERRLERTDAYPESARRRAVERKQSYRQRNNSSAPPIAVVGMAKSGRRRVPI